MLPAALVIITNRGQYGSTVAGFSIRRRYEDADKNRRVLTNLMLSTCRPEHVKHSFLFYSKINMSLTSCSRIEK